MKKRRHLRIMIKRKANEKGLTQKQFFNDLGYSTAYTFYNGNPSGKAICSFFLKIGMGEMTIRQMYDLMEY